MNPREAFQPNASWGTYLWKPSQKKKKKKKQMEKGNELLIKVAADGFLAAHMK